MDTIELVKRQRPEVQALGATDKSRIRQRVVGHDPGEVSSAGPNDQYLGPGDDGKHSNGVPRRTLVALAASAVLIGGVVSIAAFAPRSSTEPTLEQPSSSDSLPSTSVESKPATTRAAIGELRPVASLGPADLIIPTIIPRGMSLSPYLLDGLDRFSVTEDGTGAEITVAVVDEIDELSTPLINTSLDTWQVEEFGPGRIQYVARAGDRFVVVDVLDFGGDLTDESLMDFLEGLRVGGEADFPGVVFDPETSGTVVAQSTDGSEVLRVTITDGWVCSAIELIEPAPIRGRCQQNQVGETMVQILGGGSVVVENLDGGVVEATSTSSGMVRADVALVELELSNGDVISVEPEDRSDMFDERFFVVSYPVDAIPAPSGQSTSLSEVAEIRAYDPAGNQL